MRRCFTCHESKPLTEFHNENRRPGGKRYECKVCTNTRCKLHHAKPEIKARENDRRKQRYLDPKERERQKYATLLTRYGLTRKQHVELLVKQGAGCAICLKTDKKLYVDHCHNSKIVRGLLCPRCNYAVGLLYDNAEMMLRAAQYITPSIQISQVA